MRAINKFLLQNSLTLDGISIMNNLITTTPERPMVDAVQEVQIQTGTVAGTATISLVVTSSGVNVTPANVTPVQITIAPAPPTITTSAIARSGNTLSVSVDGFSNTRELTTAIFHFTAVPGSTISTPDITAPVGTVFGNYFSSSASTAYGSTFLYIQSFNLSGNDASSIQSVTVMLVNSQGDSMVATAQLFVRLS